MAPSEQAVQDRYPEAQAQCYGCGRLNPEGLHLKTYRDDGETVCRFTPDPHHKAFPGIVYGGLIASLFDCHGIGTASAEMERRRRAEREGSSARDETAGGGARGEGPTGEGPTGSETATTGSPSDEPPPRFVTASLRVDFVRPTPLGPELEIRGRVREVGERKVVVDETLTVEGEVRARATVVAVRMPREMGA